jgi:hypothetical protein
LEGAFSVHARGTIRAGVGATFINIVAIALLSTSVISGFAGALVSSRSVFTYSIWITWAINAFIFIYTGISITFVTPSAFAFEVVSSTWDTFGVVAAWFVMTHVSSFTTHFDVVHHKTVFTLALIWTNIVITNRITATRTIVLAFIYVVAVKTVTLEALVAGAFEAALGICAGGTFVAWIVQTLIDIFTTVHWTLVPGRANP